MNQCTPGSVFTTRGYFKEETSMIERRGADALFLPPTIPGQNRPQQHTIFKRKSHSFTHSHSHTGISWQSRIKQVSHQDWWLWKVLLPDKGPDGAKVAEMMKYWRKIPITKPGFEPRKLEMKVGRSNHFTVRTHSMSQKRDWLKNCIQHYSK
jgi:hypothetical protein